LAQYLDQSVLCTTTNVLERSLCMPDVDSLTCVIQFNPGPENRLHPVSQCWLRGAVAARTLIHGGPGALAVHHAGLGLAAAGLAAASSPAVSPAYFSTVSL